MRRDDGIFDVDLRSLAIAEYAVPVLRIRSDKGILQGNLCTVSGKEGRVLSVEIACFGIGRSARYLFCDDAVKRNVCARNECLNNLV